MNRLWASQSGKRIVVMSLIFFLICVVHNILYNMKDALVITAIGSGAEVIPFIQLWLLFPVTCGMTLWFTNLLRQKGLVKVIERLLTAFLVFFVIFTCVLYPCRDFVEPHALAEAVVEYVPTGLVGLVAMVRHWILSVFFVVAEMWACMVTAVIFWTLANEITPLDEAQQSYSWVRVGGALGAAIGGQVPIITNFIMPDLSVYGLMGVVIVGCGSTLLLIRYLVTRLVERPIGANVQAQESLMQQVMGLFRSRYLLCLAVMVIAYNLVMNLFEIVWKAELKLIYTDFNHYNAVLGHASTLCGILTVILSLAMPKLLEKLGWTKIAMISPVFQLVSSGIFFGILLCQEYVPMDHETLVLLLVVLGGIQFSAGRASKHSLFDVSKDMAFIPLESHVKAQGKAAVDGLGSRMGRSAASLIHQGLLLVFATVGGGVPVLAVVVVAVIVGWMAAARNLGRQMEVSVDAPEKAMPLAA